MVELISLQQFKPATQHVNLQEFGLIFRLEAQINGRRELDAAIVSVLFAYPPRGCIGSPSPDLAPETQRTPFIHSHISSPCIDHRVRADGSVSGILAMTKNILFTVFLPRELHWKSFIARSVESEEISPETVYGIY